MLAWCTAEFPSIPETPDPSILNVANGLLDWRDGDLRPHDPEVPSIVQVPVVWDPKAKCPKIARFLGEVLPADTAELFYEIAGYCLLPDQPLRRAVMFLGEGRNGKSVALGVLRALLGHRNVSSVALQDLGEDRFAAAQLYGRLANLCGDLDARALRRTDVFKTLTGGTDEIMAQHKYRDPFSFVPYATLVFSANEAPASSDQTEAFFDRWIVVPFPNRITEDKDDPHLLGKLTTPTEQAGLLVKAVQGLDRLMDRGRFDLPESVREAGRAYRERIDTIATFVDERCRLGLAESVGRSELYETYRVWCSSNGQQAVSQQLFGPQLRHKFGVEDGRTHDERVWLGLGLGRRR